MSNPKCCFGSLPDLMAFLATHRKSSITLGISSNANQLNKQNNACINLWYIIYIIHTCMRNSANMPNLKEEDTSFAMDRF